MWLPPVFPYQDVTQHAVQQGYRRRKVQDQLRQPNQTRILPSTVREAVNDQTVHAKQANRTSLRSRYERELRYLPRVRQCTESMPGPNARGVYRARPIPTHKVPIRRVREPRRPSIESELPIPRWAVEVCCLRAFSMGLHSGWGAVVSGAIFRGGVTTCCALKYGLGFTRASAVKGILTRRNMHGTHPNRGTSVYIIGAYSIARLTSGGYHRTVHQVNGRRPKTFVIIANYCTRLGPRRISRVRKISLILKTRRGLSLLVCLSSLGGERRKNTVVTSQAGSVHAFSPSYSTSSHAHRFLGIRSKYSCFYSCYAVPFTHKHDHGKAVTDVIGRTRRITSGKKGRVILANIGVNSFKGDAKRAFVSLVHTLSRIRKVMHCHVSSVRPGLVASRTVSFITYDEHFTPRFRVPLRDKDSRILGLVHHHCSAVLFQRGVRGVGRIVPRTFVNISIVINAQNRASAYFRRTHAFVRDLSVDRLRIFDCSRQPNARTLGVSRIISPGAGRTHDRRLLSVSSHGLRTFCRTRVNRGTGILFRRAHGKNVVRNFARGCVGIRVPCSRSLIGRAQRIVLRN